MIKDALLEIIRRRRKMSLAAPRAHRVTDFSAIANILYIIALCDSGKKALLCSKRPPLIGRFQMYIRKRQFNRCVCECARGCSWNRESMLQGCFSLWHTLRMLYEIPACWLSLPPERVRVYVLTSDAEISLGKPFVRAYKWKKRAGENSQLICLQISMANTRGRGSVFN
jgi:hypothetical protein